MLKAENTNMNMSGSSFNEELNLSLANMSATSNSGNDVYMSISIPNYIDVITNKDMFLADLETFINQFLEVVVDLKD